MGTGIQLNSPAGYDTFSQTGAEGNAPADTYDVYTYNVDVSAGETITISGDFDLKGDPVTGGEFTFSGLSFGTFSVDTSTGIWSYEVDRATLDANGGNQTLSFTVGHTGTDGLGAPTVFDVDTVNIVLTCFARGTRIATPKGDLAVESLLPGDLVRTADGRDVPVRWVGKQTVLTVFAPAERLMPVRVAAGALDAGVPSRDLIVTGDHALLVDGVLAHAAALVGLPGVTREPLENLGTSYEVYAIETAAHDVILAEGTPAETFVDNVSRRVFDNHAEYLSLFGAETALTELTLPRAMSARQLPPALRARLAGQAAA